MSNMLDIIWVVKSSNIRGYEPHAHSECFQMAYILKGMSEIDIDGSVYELSADDIYIVNPKVSHRLCVKGKEEQHAYEVKFSMPAGIFYDQVCALPPIIRNCPPAIKALMYNIWSESFYKMSGYKECVHHYAALLLYSLLRLKMPDILPVEPVSSVEKGEAEMVHRVKMFLQGNLSCKFTLDDISDHLGYNKSYLCKNFKTETNMTIMEYFNILRIQKAQRMLNETKMTLKEIGEFLGFETIHHFSRVFKRVSGMSPSHFRKKYLDGDNVGISIQETYVNPDYLILR